MIIWNSVLFAGIAVVHVGVVWAVAYASGQSRKSLNALLMFPHASLSIAMVLYQGTTFAAYRSIFHQDIVYLPITVPCVLFFSIGMPLVSLWWVRTRLSAAWTPNRADIRFSPKGIWLPADMPSRYGFFFDEFQGPQKDFKVKVFVFHHILALLTSIQPTSDLGCNLQISGCIVATAGMSAVFVYFRPLRWTACNFTRAVTLAAQCSQLMGSILSAPDTIEDLITVLVMVSCAVESVVSTAAFLREYKIYPLLVQTSDKPDEPVNVTEPVIREFVENPFLNFEEDDLRAMEMEQRLLSESPLPAHSERKPPAEARVNPPAQTNDGELGWDDL